MDALIILFLPMIIVCIPVFVLTRLSILAFKRMNDRATAEIMEQLQPVNLLVQLLYPATVLLIFNYSSGSFAQQPAGRIIFIALLALYSWSLAIHSDRGPYIGWKVFFFLFNFFISLWVSVVLLFSGFSGLSFG